MNGTFVNDVKIDERCDLKHNDVIGVGCSEFSFNGPEENLPVKKDEMFVYRLTKKTDHSIEISDDDDDIVGAEDIKPVISNGIAKNEPVKRATVANRLVTDSSPQQNNGMLIFHYISPVLIFFLFVCP